MKSHVLTENTRLTPEAKRYVEERLGKELDNLLTWAENENDYRILGGILAAIIGERVADKVAKLQGKSTNGAI